MRPGWGDRGETPFKTTNYLKIRKKTLKIGFIFNLYEKCWSSSESLIFDRYGKSSA